MNNPPNDGSPGLDSPAGGVDPALTRFVDSPVFCQRAVCLALFFGTLLLFSRAVGHAFLDYDDPDYVTHNVHVQAGLTWAGIRWACTSGDAANWFPLTWLSHMLDWQLFGNNPHGHHATNILWHALSAVMAFLALRRLTNTFWPSAISAALFAWHPLRVESVAWVAERKDVLSVFFGLLTLWAYAVYAERRRENCPGPARYYVLALAAFATGLLCKPMLVTLPCLLLLLDWWPLKRVGSTEKVSSLLLEKTPFLLLTVASCIITYQVQKAGHAVAESFSFGARLANAVVSIARYLGRFFWPFDLAVCYSEPPRWPAVFVAGAALLSLSITAVALWQWRRRPWLLAGWLWFVGMLVPVIGIVHVGLQAMADRYTYLPMLGLSVALVWTFGELTPPTTMRWLKSAVVTLMLAGCAARTWDQLGVWKNSHTLYEHALAVTKDNYLAHGNLGTTLLNEDRLVEAEHQFRFAIELKPDYAAARERLGVALEEQGREDDALATYAELLRLRPNFAAAHYHTGVILLKRHQPADAIPHFQAALRTRPSADLAYIGLGMAAAQLGRPQEAITKYEQALALNPNSAEAHYDYANVLASVHRDQQALPHYEMAIQLNPDFAEAHCNYANSLRALGRSAEACAQYRRALSLQPKDASAHFGLGVALEELGRTSEALASYTEAIRIAPEYADAQYNTGVLLLNQKHPAEAIVHFQAAVQSEPEYAAAYSGLGLAEAELGQTQEAIQHLERALRLEPNFPGASETLAQLRRGGAAGDKQ
jgi:tetratricopeptide (TPR) repeat protein